MAHKFWYEVQCHREFLSRKLVWNLEPQHPREIRFPNYRISFSETPENKIPVSLGARNPLVSRCIPEIVKNTTVASVGWSAISSSPRALAIALKLWESTCKPNYDRDGDMIAMKFQADDGLEVKRLAMKWEWKRPWRHNEHSSFFMRGTTLRYSGPHHPWKTGEAGDNRWKKVI